jgi:hypothetical protein
LAPEKRQAKENNETMLKKTIMNKSRRRRETGTNRAGFEAKGKEGVANLCVFALTSMCLFSPSLSAEAEGAGIKG